MAKLSGDTQVNARILYWGIAGAGKSTNLQVAYAKLRPDHRGELALEASALGLDPVERADLDRSRGLGRQADADLEGALFDQLEPFLSSFHGSVQRMFGDFLPLDFLGMCRIGFEGRADANQRSHNHTSRPNIAKA